MEVHWLQLNTSLLEKLVSAERLISLAKAGTSWSVKSYMRCIQKRKKVLYLFCPLQVKTIGRAYQREVEKDDSMSSKWFQMPWRYRVMGSTCRATGGDSATWFSYFLWHLLALGPHWMWLYRGLPLALTGRLLVGWDRGGVTYIQKEKLGQIALWTG